MPPRGSAVPDPKNLPPPSILFPHHLLIRILSHLKTPLHADCLRVIPVEERRVDLDARRSPARDAQLDDNPIVVFRVMPPRLPPVVPSAGGHEDARAANRRLRVRKVGRGGKPLVGTREDGRGKGG